MFEKKTTRYLIAVKKLQPRWGKKPKELKILFRIPWFPIHNGAIFLISNSIRSEM